MSIRNNLKTVLLIGGLTCFSAVGAKSPVWKVSKGDDYMYLGGTIHLLSKDDYPLPAAFDSAYKDAEHVWFETDISMLSGPEAQLQMLKVMMYQDEQTLSGVLSEETYKGLASLLEERKIPIAAMEKLTPAGLMFTLTIMELQRLGLADPEAGVDAYFDNRAEADSKPRRYLESIEEQLSFISSLNEVDPDRLVNSVIEDVNKTSEIWNRMLAAWETGNASALEALGVEEMQADFPAVYNKLLAERNANWMPDIESMLKSEEIELVLVGALHMAGDDGLLQKLTKAGYKIEQLD